MAGAGINSCADTLFGASGRKVVCEELWVIRRTAEEGLWVARWISSCKIFQLLFFLMIWLLMVFFTFIDSSF